jgi:hypothetical protein
MPGRAALTLTIVGFWTAGGLLLERHVGLSGQIALGLLTCGVLAGLLALHNPAVRLQTLLVVAVASAGEVVGSLVWGLYSYRLDNLPAFVPPGHGLVYLGGLALGACFGRHRRWLVGAALAGVVAWGVVGIVAVPTPDVTGALGCATLALVLLATRRAAYAGVFVVVAALELYGTALGTWTWEASVPGLGLPQGNPPSGVASGYVLFDVLALALAPHVLRLTSPARRSGRRPEPAWP